METHWANFVMINYLSFVLFVILNNCNPICLWIELPATSAGHFWWRRKKKVCFRQSWLHWHAGIPTLHTTAPGTGNRKMRKMWPFSLKNSPSQREDGWMQAGNMYHMAQLQRMSAKAGDTGLIPGSGRSPGEGNDNLFQYSCLGNPIDRGAWWATVHGVTKEPVTT